MSNSQHIFLTGLYSQLEAHLDDADIGVNQLAALVNVSRSSLHRKLKSVTGLSTSEVVRNFRLSRGAAFLRQGFSSADAAYKCGFGSPAYFTKCFRQLYGLTPTHYIHEVCNRSGVPSERWRENRLQAIRQNDVGCFYIVPKLIDRLGVDRNGRHRKLKRLRGIYVKMSQSSRLLC
jgi:AraC-like DNA-binding protein